MIIPQKDLFYTGIGSRKTPNDIMDIMSSVASYLESVGMKLRSGGADGADTAFERGVSDSSMMEIYLPWPGFNGRTGDGYVTSYADCHMDMARASHPGWGYLGRGPRALHTRNVAQVIGSNCDTPSQFVICWTPDGAIRGGSATAIKIAYARSIPVYNIFHERPRSAVLDMIATGVLDESVLV